MRGCVNISLAYSPGARHLREWLLQLPDGATVSQALVQSGILDEFESLKQAPLMLGIWGKRASLQQLLHDNDRIEIYRQLRVDPKVARRERFKGQGSKGTGLFSAKRAGAKAGY